MSKKTVKCKDNKCKKNTKNTKKQRGSGGGKNDNSGMGNSNSNNSNGNSNDNQIMDKYITFFPETNIIYHKNVKLVPGNKKKVVSTNIFIPNHLDIKPKNYMYISGLIKSVETFPQELKDKGWIYRIYYDKIFIDINDDYISLVDEIYETEQNNTNKNRVIKNRYLEKKNILFNYCKLFRSYLKTIIENKDDKYKHVELVEFESPLMGKIVSTTYKKNKYLGTPETFGSIVRMLAIYDPYVSTWVLVNSRNTINPILKEMILEFDSNDNNNALIFQFNHYVWNVGIYNKNDLTKIIKIQDIENIIQNHKNSLKNDKIIPNKDMYLWDSIKPTLDDILANNRSIKEKSIKEKSIFIIPPYYKYPRLLAGLIGGKNNDKINYHKYSFETFIKKLIEMDNEFLYGIDEYILSMIIMHDNIQKIHNWRHYAGKENPKDIIIYNGIGESFMKVVKNKIQKFITHSELDNNIVIKTSALFISDIINQLYHQNTFPYYIFELLSVDAIEYNKDHAQLIDLITSVNEKKLLLCSNDIINKENTLVKYQRLGPKQKEIASKLFNHMFEFIIIPFDKMIKDQEVTVIKEKIIKHYKDNIISIAYRKKNIELKEREYKNKTETEISENIKTLYSKIPGVEDNKTVKNTQNHSTSYQSLDDLLAEGPNETHDA